MEFDRRGIFDAILMLAVFCLIPGTPIIQLFGRTRFLALYFVGAAASSAAHLWYHNVYLPSQYKTRNTA